jgi:hypothetical protein
MSLVEGLLLVGALAKFAGWIPSPPSAACTQQKIVSQTFFESLGLVASYLETESWPRSKTCNDKLVILLYFIRNEERF